MIDELEASNAFHHVAERDELFQIDVPMLAGFCEQIIELSDRPRVRVLPRIDRFDRFVSVIVYVPRDQYDSDARERIGAYLKDVFDARLSAYYPAFLEGGVARVHFVLGRSSERRRASPRTRWKTRCAQSLPAGRIALRRSWASRRCRCTRRMPIATTSPRKRRWRILPISSPAATTIRSISISTSATVSPATTCR